MTCPNPKTTKTPSLLSSKADKDLVAMVKNTAHNEAFLEICRRYENIFYKVCQKYAGYLSGVGVNPQDIFDEKNYIIFHCISTFQSKKKTKLGTWIGNYARYLCLNSINSRKFILPATDDDLKKHIEEAQITSDYLHNGPNPQEEMNYILNLLRQLKDQRIYQIFRLRYLSPRRLIWATIASKVGVSTQTVINLHNKGLAMLKRKLKSVNISDII